MDQIISLFNQYVDFKLVLLIIISSYWIKKNFSDVLTRITIAHKVFIWSTLVTVFYYWVMHLSGSFTKAGMVNYFLSYTVATSIYEIAMNPIENFLKNRFGGKK